MKQIHLAALTVATSVTSTAFATQYLTVEQVQQLMFPNATDFKNTNLKLSSEQMKQIEKISALPARSVDWRVFTAYQGDVRLGYIVLDDVIGKFELISYAVGLHVDASIKQIEILNYRESHGFEIKNPMWRKQFVGKTAETGLTIGDGIASISGATLSCTHVTDGVRRIAAIAQVMLKK